MSLDGVSRIGAASGGGMGSLDLEAVSAQVDSARAAEQSQKLEQTAAAAEAQNGQVSPQQLARLKAVTQDFESLFLGYMLKTMRASVPKTGFWGSSKDQATQIFTEMRDDELAKSMAKAGGIGLADMVDKQLKQTMEMQARSAALAASLAAKSRHKD